MESITRKRLKCYMDFECLHTIIHRLKLFRLYHALTQQQVADVLNIERSTYSYYELDKVQINIGCLILLSRFYKVSLDLLVGNI